MDDLSSMAFTECWFRGKEATIPNDRLQQFEQNCRASLVPEIQQQRSSMRSAEQEMAAAYQSLYRALQAKSGDEAIRPKVLLDDQRAWFKFREAHCWLEMQRSSGGNYRLTYRFAKCVETEARKRTGYLRGFLQRDAG